MERSRPPKKFPKIRNNQEVYLKYELKATITKNVTHAIP